MMPTYTLTFAVRNLMHGDLSSENAQDLALSICASTKSILTVLSDALRTNHRLSSESDIVGTIETCAALIETAQEIQAKEE